MSTTLAQRIHGAIRRVLDAYPGAWLVWCDPRGDWAPLLEGMASDTKLGGFSLLVVGESTGGAVGSPLFRRQLQERLDAHDPLVLLVRAGEDDLGWLWSQALLAEHIYGLSLREQLLAWGWRPQSLTTSDDELAALARQYRDQDPQEWSGGGLQPEHLDRPLAHLDLADLAGDGHREVLVRAEHVHVPRHLEVRDAPGRIGLHRLGGQRIGARPLLDPRHQLLAVPHVRDADDLHIDHVRVGVEELLDLARVDVLATSDDQVLDPANDGEVAGVVHHGQVAGVHPAGLVDHLVRHGRLLPVAEHHRVAAGAELPRRAARHSQPVLGVDHLDLQVRVHPPDGRYPALQVVVTAGLRRHR